MAITAASIEANGWVLAITHNRGLGSFANYALSPDATPALTVTSQHPGYDLSGGVAVANAAKPRRFVGTKPLRQAAVVSNAGVLSAKAIDETDNGNGTVTVRIALSNWVYATDTALTLTALAGWRTGEAAATIAVTNNSTVACPAPVHRWCDVPYKLVRGSFDVELQVYGFFPQGNQPVAAVKFTVTDGTTVKTFWSSALSSSTQFGDNLRCHRVTVDPSTATALTAGLLRIDAEVYPWIGAMRPTDTAGTKSMTAMSAVNTGDAFLGQAQAPFAVAYDPAGTRYPFKCVFVDFTNGSATAATAMIGSGSSDATALTAAKAVAPAARAKDVATAVEALRLAGFSYAAANGQAAQSMILDGCRIVLAAQTHTNGLGGGTVGYTPNVIETWLRIEGDPADSNPRTNVVVRTATGISADFRNNTQRLAFANMSIELGYDLTLWAAYMWFDNIEFRGQAGMTTANHSPTGGRVPPATYLGTHFTRSRMWKTGISFDSRFGNRAKLVRNCEHRRAAEAPVCVTNRVIAEAEDNSFTGPQGNQITGALSSFTDPLSIADSIVAYCDLRACQERGWNEGVIQAAYSGGRAGANACTGQVVFGNIMEHIGNSIDPMFSIGEGELVDVSRVIIEANTIVAQRTNFFYNNPAVGASVAATDSAANSAAGNSTVVNVRVAGNIFAAHYSKSDRFDDPNVKAQRVAASDPRNHGVRPGLTGAYAAIYGVGQRDNVNLYQDIVSGGSGVVEAFQLEYEGLNCRWDNAPIDPKYTSDKSRWRLGVDQSATATGVGNYLPLTGSPALARVASGNSDRDVLNAPRAAVFAAGAIEGIPAVALVPAAARNSHLASTPAVGWASLVIGARTALAMRSTVIGLAWTAALNPSRSSLATRAGQANTALAGLLTGAHNALAMRAGPATLSAAGVAATAALAPGSATHGLRDAFGLVLQAGGSGGSTARMTAVPSDLRVQSITLS